MEGRDVRMTRRHALVAAAVAAGAAASAGPVAAAAAGPVLHARRAATYTRLVAALRGDGDGRFAHKRPLAATRAFARWYASGDPATRAHADEVLDRLAAARLRRHADLVRARGEQGALVAAAVALAAVACEPPPAEDERPVTPALAP